MPELEPAARNARSGTNPGLKPVCCFECPHDGKGAVIDKASPANASIAMHAHTNKFHPQPEISMNTPCECGHSKAAHPFPYNACNSCGCGRYTAVREGEQ